jgi:hypothetical protein
MVAEFEVGGRHASGEKDVNKDSSSRYVARRGLSTWVLRRTVVQATVLVGALTLLSPATGLRALSPDGRMAFLSRNFVQSFLQKVKGHRPAENQPLNRCHQTDGACHGRSAFQTRSTTRSSSENPRHGHSSLSCDMCSPSDSRSISSNPPSASPPPGVRRSESDPGLQLRLQSGDGESPVSPWTQATPIRREDEDDAAFYAHAADTGDGVREAKEEVEAVDALGMLQSNSTLASTSRQLPRSCDLP